MPYMTRLSLCTGLLLALAAAQESVSAADRYCSPGGAYSKSDAGYGVVQTGFAGDFSDDAERYSSGFESWLQDVKDCMRRRRLRGYKRVQQCAPEVPLPAVPAVSLTDLWIPSHAVAPISAGLRVRVDERTRRTGLADAVRRARNAPVHSDAVGNPGTVPQLSPPQEAPYFPEAAPLIQPSDPAPAAPPIEAPDFPTDAGFLPRQSNVDTAAFDLPVIMHIQ